MQPVSLLDKTTYMVNGKTYTVGQEVEIPAAEAVIKGIGAISTADIQKRLIEISTELKALRIKVLEILCAGNVAVYDEGLVDMHREFEDLERDFIYLSDLLFKTIQTVLGGNLPMNRNADTGAVTVRARDERADEAINPMRDVIGAKFRFHLIEPMLVILRKLSCDPVIDHERRKDVRLPMVSAKGSPTWLTPDKTVDDIATAAGAVFNDLTRLIHPVVVFWVSQDGSSVVAVEGRGLNHQQAPMMDPRQCFNYAVERLAATLEPPKLVGVASIGNVGFLKQGTKGVYVGAMDQDGKAHHSFQTVNEKGEFRVEQSDASTGHESLTATFKRAFGK